MNAQNQTIASWLKYASNHLSQYGDNTARLDALVLLEDVLSKDRSWLLAHPELKITSPKLKKLNVFITRRLNHEPLAYIRNKTEFYGRNLYIDNRVLEPRPESEAMIDMLKELELPVRPTIIDIGTGSGALAITAKIEMPSSYVIASDIDKNCLSVARKNINNYKLDIKTYRGSLLSALPLDGIIGHDTILLCNLPYVPDNFRLNQAALNEPKLAIFGGKDGLDIYRQLFIQCVELNFKPEFILTESMPPQHNKLKSITLSGGYNLLKSDDFIQVFSI